MANYGGYELNELEVLEQKSDQSQSTESTDSTQEPTYVTLDTLKSKLAEGVNIESIIEIKPYISITIKQILIDSIIKSSTDYDDKTGLTKINYCNLELFKNIYILQAYTNLLLDNENIINEYDYLEQNGIMNLIYECINEDELFMIDKILNKQIEQDLKLSNSIEGIISNNLNLFQSKLDDVINMIPTIDEKSIDSWMQLASKTISNFDPRKMKMIKNMMDFANGKGE